MRTLSLLAGALALAACASDKADVERLRPRAAEQIDPRVAVPSPPVPVATGALGARLRQMVDEARQVAAPFDRALPATRAAVRRAGAAQSESWIAAQQSLSALASLRGPVAKVLADIDAIGADAIQARGGLGQRDQEAVDAAAAEVAAIDQRQQSDLDSLTNQIKR